MIQEILSDTAIKIYSFAATFLLIPVYKWVKKVKEEKADLVGRVTRLEQKFDTEIEERRNMEKKLDSIHEMLTEVRINTAVNASKLSNRD